MLQSLISYFTKMSTFKIASFSCKNIQVPKFLNLVVKYSETSGLSVFSSVRAHYSGVVVLVYGDKLILAILTSLLIKYMYSVAENICNYSYNTFLLYFHCGFSYNLTLSVVHCNLFTYHSTILN